jgi:hypothetical protein
MSAARRPSCPLGVWGALALVALTAGCARRGTAGLPPGTTVEDLPDSESWDVRLRSSEDGRARLDVDAPYLARYTRDSSYVYLGPPPGAERASDVVVSVFAEDGTPRARLVAREAWVYDEGERVEAQGRVRADVAGEDGAEVEADRVALADEAVEAAGRVRAEVRGGGGAAVRAPRLTTAEDGSFVASGGATADLRGAGATVRARRISGTGGGRYEAEGGVRVQTSGGRTLTASRVVWDDAAGQFRVPGAFSFDGPGERVRGVGLVANADLSRYSFRDVTGEIEVAE